MSVVVYDGTVLAADRLAVTSDMRRLCSKIRRDGGGRFFAWVGIHENGCILAQWYIDGTKVADWPKFQDDKDAWTRLIVATAHGVATCERQPVFLPVFDTFTAWGSGRDYAMGAMARGATAVEAVQIASQFDINCGFGVEAYELATEKFVGTIP